MLKTIEERLKSYEPLWENWTYSGEFLGEGAMSSVFEIQSTAMGFKEVAALKIITVKKNHLGEVKLSKEAQNEIRILKDLSNCPNIVHYHDSTQRKIFDDDNNLSEIDVLIKMEKLQPLSEDSNLSKEEVIKLAKDMCNALIHASNHGIIHRDIKPQNIFVDHDGIYKLGDFGIAKIVSDSTERFTMNIGTLAYVAPEIHKNPSGVYDIASDVYSLGLVLYLYLNNGCLPFVTSTSSLGEAVTKRLNGDKFPSPANGSKLLKDIVMRACNKDLKKRYKTPQEMLEDLELLSTGGRKLVVDPFATLDANLDVSESSLTIGDSATHGTISVASSDALKTGTLTTHKDGAGKTNSGVKLIINMGKKTTETASATSTIISHKSDSSPGALSSDDSDKTSVKSENSSSGPRLIIKMGSASASGTSETTSKSSAIVEGNDYLETEKSEETKKSTGKSSFFNTPNSL